MSDEPGFFVGAEWEEERYLYRIIRCAPKSVVLESVTGHQWRWPRERLKRRARWIVAREETVSR